MPRKLQERTRRPERKGRRFENQEFYSTLPSSPPIKEGQEINAFISDVSSEGDGIARIQSFPIFVPKTRVGQRVKVKITRVERRFVLAEKLNEVEDRDEN
ncbi:MAG: TRAM domain-containing protein [Candidatus Bathyarchaeia archaeon]